MAGKPFASGVYVSRAELSLHHLLLAHYWAAQALELGADQDQLAARISNRRGPDPFSSFRIGLGRVADKLMVGDRLCSRIRPPKIGNWRYLVTLPSFGESEASVRRSSVTSPSRPRELIATERLSRSFTIALSVHHLRCRCGREICENHPGVRFWIWTAVVWKIGISEILTQPQFYSTSYRRVSLKL
jgi:hypothetical protein